ncbi:hypothetical protein PIB30_085875 [Stylosanthes scabra]|uniref:Uncharacterized protein n=1 Tax=Stylosanthes scabra TaxID=79078 RepID=A0ABU6YRR5_9FABA|nr:hypothetical protein [Stylosanthes scabra]
MLGSKRASNAPSPCSKLTVVVFKLAIVPAKSFIAVLKLAVVSAVFPGSFLFTPFLCLNNRRRLRKGGTQNSAPSNNDASEVADGGEDMMLLSFTLPKFSVTVFLMLSPYTLDPINILACLVIDMLNSSAQEHP